MNKALKTLTLALALTSLVMALGSQIPSILPVSPVTENIVFEKNATVQGIWGISANSRNLKTWWDFEDFYLGIKGTRWLTTVSGTAAIASDNLGTALRPGILYLSTGTTNAGLAVLYNATNVRSFLFGGGIYTIEADIYITTLSTVAETYALRFGFGDSLTGVPTDGAYFYYTDTGANPNWYRNTVSNTALTSTDTGVVAVAGAWIRLKTVVNAAATSVEYFINGVSVGSNVANIPSGAGRQTAVILSIVKSAGTTARLVDIDWVWLHVDLTASR